MTRKTARSRLLAASQRSPSLLEKVKREFSGLPVYVGVEEGYVKRTAPMDKRQFRRYLKTCRRLSFRFDRRGRGGSSRWRSYSHLQRYKQASTFNTDPHRLDTRRLRPARTPPLMDRLVEAVAEYLYRHRSVGLFRLTFDLTRRRLDLFAEVGAVEVVKGAVAPPTPGTETWWRAVAAVREAVYALRQRGLVQYIKEAEVVNWTDPPC